MQGSGKLQKPREKEMPCRSVNRGSRVLHRFPIAVVVQTANQGVVADCPWRAQSCLLRSDCGMDISSQLLAGPDFRRAISTHFGCVRPSRPPPWDMICKHQGGIIAAPPRHAQVCAWHKQRFGCRRGDAIAVASTMRRLTSTAGPIIALERPLLPLQSGEAPRRPAFLRCEDLPRGVA